MSATFPEDEERCSDIIDQASAVEARDRSIREAIARGKAAPEQFPVEGEDGKPLVGTNGLIVWSVTECVECGEDLPYARQALARVRCVPCQQDKEIKDKRYGK